MLSSTTLLEGASSCALTCAARLAANHSWHLPHNRSIASRSSPIDSMIRHQFDLASASKQFVDADKKRLFAPSLQELTPGLTPTSKKQPLTKYYVPFFLANATTPFIAYTAEYGITRTERYVDRDGKEQERTYIDWYPTSGNIGPRGYSIDDCQMQVYGGFKWPSGRVEEAISGYNLSQKLHAYDPKNVDGETKVDQFLKRGALARSTALARIKSDLECCIEADVQRRTFHWNVYVRDITFDFQVTDFQLKSALLPFYVLKYPRMPARFMPALSQNKVKVVGPAPLSEIKVTLAGAATTALASLFFPATIPARIAFIGASAIISNLWARYRLPLSESFSKYQIRSEIKENESIGETPKDRLRREATEAFAPPSPPPEEHEEAEDGEIVVVESFHFVSLGLDPQKPVTKEEINKAFHEKIKLHHTDVGGSSDEARRIIAARSALLNALSKQRPNGFSGKRNYSTVASAQKVKKPPQSIYDPSARKLIDAVLVEKNYDKARRLVYDEEIHPDSHDKGENTLLTEAAKRGDLKAIEFAIDELGANCDSSCDCPKHMTMLHYLAKKGNVQGIKLVLDKGATVNLINSDGETPLDTALLNGHKEAAEYLRGRGFVQHATKPGALGLFKKLTGYSSDERTILLEKELVEKVKNLKIKDE